MKKIVLTGGGTAGHVTPNMALIPRLHDAGFEIHYIGTSGIERDLISSFDYVTYHVIQSGKLRRYFSLKNLSDPFRVMNGIRQSRQILKSIRPDVVFSKGGFVAVPVVAASRGIAPVIAHESDFTPGLATKISAKFAKTVCTTFDETLQYLGKNAVYTGTPIREALFNGNADAGKKYLGFDNSNKPIMLVMGGSLGAAAINSAVRASLNVLSKTFNIAHICGKDKLDNSITMDGYSQFEYISNQLPDVFAASTLIVSRAGANSVFEFLALRKPTVLVPLPSASSRGDQLLNAAYFEKMGYAKVLQQELITEQTLVDAINCLYSDRAEYIKHMNDDKTARFGTDNVLSQIYKVAEAAERDGNK